MNRKNALFLTLLAGLAIALTLLVLPGLTLAAPDRLQDPDLLQDVVIINEIRIDQTGADNDEYFELAGPAGTPLHMLTYLVIGDATVGGSGVIEAVVPLTGQSIPASGYLVVAESTFTLGTADMVADLNFENSDNVTHLLVAGFTGMDGQDLDTNDDGTLDVQPWTAVVDLIALVEEENPPAATEYHYGPPSVGPDAGGFVPSHAYRCIWGWEIGAFDPAAGADTPGAINACASLDLSVTKEGPVCAAPGEQVVYTVEVSNLAGADADNAVLTDTLPSGTTYVADDSGWPCPSCVVGAAGEITWNIGTVPFGTVHTFNLTVTVDAAITDPMLTNRVELQSDLPGDDLENNVATWETSLATLRIHDIQGATHFSPYEGQLVCEVPGIVTVVTPQGFYMQDPMPDDDEATSEGILVFYGGAPPVMEGYEVLVTATVDEFFPGGIDSGNLPTTELTNPTIEVTSIDIPLPAPTIIGLGGRVPPTQTIENDAMGDVLVSGVFDPAEDGLDFYESLEGMLVQVNDAVAVGPTNFFGEIPVVSNDQAYGGLYNPREGIVIQPDDFNPERVIIDDALVSAEPLVETGAEFTAPITGVMDYSFGNYKLLNPEPLPPVTPSDIVSETTSLSTGLTVATFNVQNLDPSDPSFDELGTQIVDHLLSPDIIGLQEIQDNTGPVDDGTVSASETYNMLIAAIQAAGGPVYDYREVPPVDNTSGGEPGGNIRVGYLFQPGRVTFVDRGMAGPLDATQVVVGPMGPHLSLSPGYVEPTDPAFDGARKPLAAEFHFNGQTVFLVNNHFSSKSGDDPLFGRIQPPELASEVERALQAQVVNNFVDEILAADPLADVVVLGDLNDFQFSYPISDVLAADVLYNLIWTLPEEERYTYIFDGNSQALDHILVSAHLWQMMPEYDIVHVNAEWPALERPTDHDPALARLPLLESGLAGSYKTVEPAGAAAPGDQLTYTVVLSNSGSTDVSVTITDVLPAEVVLVTGFEGGGDLIWTGMVPAGEQVTLTLVVQVDPDLTGPATFFNQVTIDDGTNPPFTIASPETTLAGAMRYYLPIIFKNAPVSVPEG